MKKLHLSKILTVAFFVLLFAVVLTVSVGAKTTDVAAGSGTLSAAINAAEAGDVLNLTGGEYTESAIISIDKSLTIEGSGTVKSSADLFKITGASVELNLGGSVVYEATTKVNDNNSPNGRGIYIAASDFTVYFKDTVQMTTGAHCVEDMTSCAGTAKIIVQGGTLTSVNAACFNFDNDLSIKVDIEISNGTLNAKSNIVRITYANGVDLKVNGGVLTSASTAVNLDGENGIVGAVTVTIAGGALTANDVHAVNLKTGKAVTTLIISGGTLSGKNMCIVLNGLANGSSATISGGTLDATDNHIIHIGNTPSGSTVTVNVTGGTWLPNNQCINNDSGSGTVNVNVSGGTFTTDQYLVRGGVATNATITGGNITVAGLTTGTVTKTTALATYTDADGKTVYADLATAVANVPADGTITVGENLTLSKTVSVTKSMTINGTGAVTSTVRFFNVAGGVTFVLDGSVSYSTTTGSIGFIVVTGNDTTVEFKSSVHVTVTHQLVTDSNGVTAAGKTTVNVYGSNVKLTSTGHHGFYFGNGYGAVEFYIEGGEFKAGTSSFCFNANAGAVKMTVLDGYYEAAVDNFFLVGGRTASFEATITTGTFKATNRNFNLGSCTATDAVVVNGGTFTANVYTVDVDNVTADVALNGGSFTAPVLFNTNNKFVGSIAAAATLNVNYVMHGATYVSAGKTVYATLPVAVANVAEKGTVTVIGNPSVSSIPVPHSVTVTGEGTVTSSGVMFDMSAAGVELTLQGNVTYNATKEGILIQANGITVNLYDSTVFTTADTASFMKDATTVTASTTTVNVFGGTYTAGGHVFEFSQGTGAVTMEIANGTFTSTANCAISITKASTVSVTVLNGTFTGNTHAINIDGHPGGTDYTVTSKISGTVALTILDGEFTGKTVHAINLKYAAEPMIVNVSGGTFIGANMGVVLNALADGSTFTVSGDSSFTANGNHIFHIANTQSGDTVNVNVAGGTFDANKIFLNVEPNAGETVVAVTGGTLEAGTSFVCANAAAVEVTVSGGTVETCTNGFELKNAASGSVTVSDAASITATANVFSVTGGYNAEINVAGGTVKAPVMFHTDYELVPTISESATVTVDYMIHGATYVNVDQKTVYATFQTALNNVTENKTVTVVGHTALASGGFEIKKGMTINGTGSVKAPSTLFNVRADAAGDTIIFNGSVVYESTGGICFSVQGGNITLEFGGTTEWTASGNFLQDADKDSITDQTTTTIIVEGAQITSTTGHAFYFGLDNGNVSLTVSSGSVTSNGKNVFVADVKCGNASLTVSGGTLTTTANDTQIGSFSTTDGNVSISVSGGELVSAKQSFWFGHGGTTTLTFTGGTFEAGGHNFDFLNGAGNLELTVSGNVDFAKSGASTFCFNGFGGDVTATISGGTWSPDGADCFYFLNACAGDVTMNISSGTFEPKNQVLNLGGNTGAVTITVSGGQFTPNTSNAIHFGSCANVTLNISGGTFNVPQDKTFVNVSGSTADITVTGGAVTSCLNGFTAYSNAAVTLNVSGTAVINASQFIASVTGGATADMTLAGGSYTAPVFFNTDATITPVISDTAVIDVDYMINGATFTDGEGNTVYADLAVAVLAVAEGGTVTVQGNPTVNDSIRVRQNVVIDGAGTVTSTTTIFNVERSVVLTLTGSVVYQTANNNVGFSIGANDVTLNLEGNIVFHTKGNLLQDSAYITADGTTTVNVSGGTFNANGHGFYFGLGAGTVKMNVSGGTINSMKHCVAISKAYAADATVTVTGGTLVAKGSARDSSCIYLGGASNGETITCTVYGGVFLSDTGYANIYVEGNNTDAAIDAVPAVNVYGGYFEDGRTACVYVYTAGVVNIYGGYFRYTGVANVYGSNVNCQGKGVVNVYGGNFRSQGSGVAFTASTANATVNLVGSFNAIGGGALITNKNTSAGTPSTGYPVGKELYNASVYMTDGAGIRLVEGSNGLRFVGVITAEALAYINTIAEAGSVSFGTLIAPADLVALADSFTVDGLTRAGVKFVDLPAKDGLVARPDGGYYIRAAIVNIREENLSREFAAVSYVKYVVNGQEVVIYASYRETKNARAIDQVARMALKDDGIYTEAQLNVLRAYAPTTEAPVIDFYLIAGQSNAAGSTNFQADFANSNPNFKNGYSNVYYSGFSMSGSGISNKMVHSAVPVKIGYGNNLTNFGPELGLADALSSHYNAQSGKYAAIIKYAYSGINLYDTVDAPCDAEGNWCPPSWLAEHGMADPVRSGQHYRAFVNYIAECVSDYEAMGYEVNIVAAYWMQGEQDVGRHGDTGEYDDLLTCFIDDLRNDVAGIMGDEKYLELPFMIGELSTYLSELSNNPTHFGNTAGLIAAQHQVAAALSNVWVLEQSNIPSFDIEPGENASNKDRYHWICENMLWIGQQLGYTVLEEILDEEVTFAEADIVAKVYLNDELIGSYKSLVGAISGAPEGAVIVLQKDVTLYSTLVIGNTNAITIDGGGYTLNIVVPVKINTGSSDDNLNCGAFRLYATDLTVRNLKVTLNDDINAEVKGVYTLFGAEVVWSGCTFTQGETTTDDFTTVTEDIPCTFDWSEIISEA